MKLSVYSVSKSTKHELLSWMDADELPTDLS